MATGTTIWCWAWRRAATPATIGAAKDVPGLVCVLTFGTGIGSALFVDGVLVPNTEFGHFEFRGGEAEDSDGRGVAG